MKWTGLGSVLEAESAGLADGLAVRGEWKRGTKNDFQIFGLNNWVDNGAIHWEHWERSKIGGQIKVLFDMMSLR